MNTCGDCFHFARFNKDEGICREGPPNVPVADQSKIVTIDGVNYPTIKAVFATVNQAVTCGKHKSSTPIDQPSGVTVHKLDAQLFEDDDARNDDPSKPDYRRGRAAPVAAPVIRRPR